MIRLLLCGLMMAHSAVAGVRSGHATVEWFAATDGYTPGQPLQLGIRLSMDPGWHGYWVNPGDGGMRLAADWTLPEGWEAGPIQYPVPIRFTAGGLVGFGYDGAVILPVKVTPAADASGPVDLAVALSWLTCNDTACVPGRAALRLSLAPGDGPSAQADTLATAISLLPQTLEGARLAVSLEDKIVRMTVELPESVDATGADLFPATPAVLDLAEDLKLTQSGEVWQAQAPLHEYADGLPPTLELVLAGGRLERPLTLTWSRDS